MNFKKSLIAAAVVAAGIAATPAMADLRVNIGFGVPMAPAPVFYQPALRPVIYQPVPAYGYDYGYGNDYRYASAHGYWVWRHGHRVWVPAHHRGRDHWRRY